MWGQSQPPVPNLKMSVRDCTLSRRDLFEFLLGLFETTVTSTSTSTVDFSFIVSLYVSDLPNVTISTSTVL